MIKKIHKDIWKKSLIDSEKDIKKALNIINHSELKIALVLEDRKLIGTVSDGDVRRGLLKKCNLNDNVKKIINKKFTYLEKNEITDSEVYDLKNKNISVIPIIDKNKQIKDVISLKTNITTKKIDNTVVLMVGGKGLRLRPFTNETPKCMLEINGKPILLRIIEQFKEYGFHDFIFSVNYLKKNIINYFKDGSKYGVKIKYIKENTPLGTAGSLGKINNKKNLPLIISNGDIITKINYDDLLNHHKRSRALITIAVRRYEMHNPYGVILTEGENFIDIVEKPTYTSMINAGVYVIDPRVLSYIKKDKFLDMPDLILKLKKDSKKINTFAVHEDWLEIGKPIDLKQARRLKI